MFGKLGRTLEETAAALEAVDPAGAEQRARRPRAGWTTTSTALEGMLSVASETARFSPPAARRSRARAALRADDAADRLRGAQHARARPLRGAPGAARRAGAAARRRGARAGVRRLAARGAVRASRARRPTCASSRSAAARMAEEIHDREPSLLTTQIVGQVRSVAVDLVRAAESLAASADAPELGPADRGAARGRARVALRRGTPRAARPPRRARGGPPRRAGRTARARSPRPHGATCRRRRRRPGTSGNDVRRLDAEQLRPVLLGQHAGAAGVHEQRRVPGRQEARRRGRAGIGQRPVRDVEQLLAVLGPERAQLQPRQHGAQRGERRPVKLATSLRDAGPNAFEVARTRRVGRRRDADAGRRRPSPRRAAKRSARRRSHVPDGGARTRSIQSPTPLRALLADQRFDLLAPQLRAAGEPAPQRARGAGHRGRARRLALRPQPQRPPRPRAWRARTARSPRRRRGGSSRASASPARPCAAPAPR